jgi:hypothetical protein
MFISSSYLGIEYGVDDKIAKFFVDRSPPPNNLYWKDKQLYLQPSSGYLIIALMVDLLYRIGVDRTELLSEGFVACMEEIGHISALEETKQISREAAIESCIAIAKEHCRSENWLTAVEDYFRCKPGNLLGSIVAPFKALHRGDVFLFSLSALSISDHLFHAIGRHCFALISSLLLLDDVEDLENDRKNNEENALLESGIDKKGIERVEELMRYNVAVISSKNSLMGKKLEQQFYELIEKIRPYPL